MPFADRAFAAGDSGFRVMALMVNVPAGSLSRKLITELPCLDVKLDFQRFTSSRRAYCPVAPVTAMIFDMSSAMGGKECVRHFSYQAGPSSSCVKF